MRRRGVPALALAPLAALVWWGAGFLPWIVDLFGRDILSTNGFSPAALPLLSGSSAGGLVVSAGVGGVLAGLVVALRRGRRVPAVLSVVAGTVVALVVAIVQARAALGDGSGAAGPVDVRVLDGLAALVVVALVVIGVAPVVRVIWWVPALVLAWIAAPTATAALYLGTSVSRGPRSADAVREYVSASWQVWRQSAEPQQRPLASWGTAIVLALVVSALVALRTRARPDRPAPDTHVVRRDPPPSDGPAWP